MKTVAIQGLKGSFHHEAAQKLLPDHEITYLECGSFPEVFAAVHDGHADYGVSAIENSLHGSINPVYRLLERYNLWICSETTLHINQYLIGAKDSNLESLNTPATEVLSQAPALAQCELWLDEHLPLAQRRETHDTADSVRYVVHQNRATHLAVAGKQAAKLYGGVIVAGPINDDPHNHTRFVLLQREPETNAAATRTSIILKTDHSLGSLYRVLSVFEANGVNLSKVDSHPIPADKRHYAFYIDFEASADSPEGQRIIAWLTSLGNDVKILGSYTVTK